MRDRKVATQPQDVERPWSSRFDCSRLYGAFTMSFTSMFQRRYPAGAEIGAGGVGFRVWAPDHNAVALLLEGGRRVPMSKEGDNGYFSVFEPGLAVGARYRFLLGGADEPLPDPASRFQPEGIGGPSVVVDPSTFAWSDASWPGLTIDGQVIYEMHVGTFTPEGTFDAAAEKLPYLRDLGVTVLEIMPLNEFEGSFGWSYDGVLPYAPTRIYGDPDAVRRFVDRAHGLGLGVILDVVYNHFGVGAITPHFAAAYQSDAPANDWGSAINFDGPGSEAVRDYFACNAAYWIDEFHLDGLRIDATQALADTSKEHIVARIVREARAAAPTRSLLIISENEPQETQQVRPVAKGGYGLDALWNDDFHHAAIVALTGRSEAYYHDTRGRPQEFVSAAKYGFLFQGQRYDWQDFPRGMPALDIAPMRFVHFLQNHDQIANSPGAARIHRRSSPARLRAMTALLLLGPQTPLLFQGQEFRADAPFSFFSDRQGDLAMKVRQGRFDFLGQFPSLRDPAARQAMRDPTDRVTFMAAKIDWAELLRHRETFDLHRDLLALRREDPTFRRAGDAVRRIDGAVIGDHAFLLRYFGENSDSDRLFLVNFGPDFAIESLAEPLAAPPFGLGWRVSWSSEHPRYGGEGRREIDPFRRWVLTADTALVFSPASAEARERPSEEQLSAFQSTI